MARKAEAAAAVLPRLPALLEQKLTKTGYTRGAVPKEVFQNRVTRNSTVLIDHAFWERCRPGAPGAPPAYQNGYIVLVKPSWYFGTVDRDARLAEQGLVIGQNALLLYQSRADWLALPPDSFGLSPGAARLAPLGGEYIARIHATVAADTLEVVEGYAVTSMRGAGIRVYEYASGETIAQARLQLECLYWLCEDAQAVAATAGMTPTDAKLRAKNQLATADARGLLKWDQLVTNRVVNGGHVTVCPLCLQPLSAQAFLQRTTQAEGRETYDLTTTEVSLFHVEELRVGSLGHKPYNLGWGHHHCNVVAKDAGIAATVQWLRELVRANDDYDKVH